VTSQGHPCARFRRALDNGSLLSARAASTELEHVGLADALELTLLIRTKEPTRFCAAALRWHAGTARTQERCGVSECYVLGRHSASQCPTC